MLCSTSYTSAGGAVRDSDKAAIQARWSPEEKELRQQIAALRQQQLFARIFGSAAPLVPARSAG
jgi:hypothetical protein